jgi:broad specificity phosphatase PhoE
MTQRPGTCRIHLVRHGETVMNVQVRFRGVLDVPLNARGRQQARDTAQRLIGAGLAAVYSSPLGRALEVANAIATACALGSVRTSDLLINLDYGEWEGLTREECAARDPQAYELYARHPEDAYCPGGETVASAADRAIAALREIGRQHPGQTVAAVSHGVMLRLAVLRVLGEREADWQFAIPMGSSLVFDVCGDEIEMVSGLDISRPDPRKGALPVVAEVAEVRR